jgi:ubiquinone/menaquinone biosynthesis C-methylase UbiE
LDSKFFESDNERWSEIDNVRKKVAKHLQVPQGSRVLDVLVGEGDFARAVAKSSKATWVMAGEILASDLEEAKRRIERNKLKERVELLRMDVTCMAFKKNSFDYVVNFSGWEDFTAISGEELIDRTFTEMVRVLKMNGTLAVTFIPALEPKDEVSRKDRELQEYMYKSSKRPRFFHEKFFLQMFEKHGIKLLGKNVFETPKNRLRPRDAKRFLEWVCNNYKNFYAPDVEMRSYEEILQEFKEFIEKHGIRERRSRFILLIGKKSGFEF